MFGFERLDVYQLALRFVVSASRIIDRFPKGQAALADQLRRASMSIVLNIAEGSGRIGRADAARHVAIARGSAMECAAILDICRVLELTGADELNAGRGMLARIVQMLTRLQHTGRN